MPMCISVVVFCCNRICGLGGLTWYDTCVSVYLYYFSKKSHLIFFDKHLPLLSALVNLGIFHQYPPGSDIRISQNVAKIMNSDAISDIVCFIVATPFLVVGCVFLGRQ